MVIAARPLTRMPANGVERPSDKNVEGSISYSVRKSSRVMSALALAQGAAYAEYPAGIAAHQLQQAIERYATRLDKMRVEHAESRFEPHDAHGAALQSARLLLLGVRRMIGGDHVDRTVGYAFQKRLAVGSRSERRIHLPATFILQILVAEYEIVGRRLARDSHAARLGTTYYVDALGSRYVAYVVSAARLLGKSHVALYLAPLALGAYTPCGRCVRHMRRREYILRAAARPLRSGRRSERRSRPPAASPAASYRRSARRCRRPRRPQHAL